MDADALRMLADLGLERRDIVSAPDEISRARTQREDPSEQAAVAAAFESRRKQVNGGGSDDDARAKRLEAWNTESTFEPDELTGQLKNRWSGQGHRSKLNRQQLNSHDDPWESVDARFGEERRLFLQERGPGAIAAGPTRSVGTGQDSFRDSVLGGKEAASRGVVGDGRRSREPAAAPPRNAAHARASSPRRFGTVRFGPGSARADANDLARAPNAADGLQSAKAALRAAAAASEECNQAQASAQTTSSTGSVSQMTCMRSNGSPLHAQRDSRSHPPKQPSTGAKVNNTPSQAIAALPSHNTTHAQLCKNTSTVASVQSLPAVGTNDYAKDPNPLAESPWHVEKCRNVALWHAANPGENCDIYYAKYPERLKYLGEARDKLIKEAIGLAMQGDEQEIEEEMKHHKERSWMIEAAKKAKQQVEHGEDNDIEAYCATHARHKPFILAAKAVFSPQRSKDTAQPRQTPVSVNPTRADAQQSSSESGATSSSRSSETDNTAQTAASSPPRSGLGTLVASFFDIAGKILGRHSVPVQIPVHAHITVTSRKAQYNPRELIGAIEGLAQSMIDRSNGLEGMRLADDGVWEDQEL